MNLRARLSDDAAGVCARVRHRRPYQHGIDRNVDARCSDDAIKHEQLRPGAREEPVNQRHSQGAIEHRRRSLLPHRYDKRCP